ncbi:MULTISPECIES: hypothetical protein [Porphyromonas]|uniref:Uncharacterized protein n=1 Tax=Porphyromonas phage phage006a_EM3 TaxID=3154098 RepID=A0AAT9J801_9CAUD|nr:MULTISPECIES: hypothetical protein [Porphyromonas]MCE8170507.1 hypothetical protein [Porphyromonas gingivalis]
MELKDFIKETILQIIAGVKNAQEEVIQFGAYVSPMFIKSDRLDTIVTTDGSKDVNVEVVNFDISVTESSSETGTKEGKIGISVIRAGGKNEKETENVSVNRISFSVPIVLPGQAFTKTKQVGFVTPPIRRDNRY